VFEEKVQQLSAREQEILRRLSDGLSNKEIATALSVTVSTVKAHLTKVFRKLGLPDRLHLALAADRRERDGAPRRRPAG
jgi:DNA-binding NarL/FixJ family response regulator